MIVLGINAAFSDPAAAVVVDGRVVATAEEDRILRRRRTRPAVPFAAWELPVAAIRSVLATAGVAASDVDLVAYSYDPQLAATPATAVADNRWEGLRALYAERIARFLAAALPELAGAAVRFVPHHVAHAASAYLVSGVPEGSVMVVDGRGERSSLLAGRVRDGELTPLLEQRLPHSLGLLYAALTEHLGLRSGRDEAKVTALAASGRPRFTAQLAAAIRCVEGWGFVTEPIAWDTLVPRRRPGEPWTSAHADLAASVQRRLEHVLRDLAIGLHERTDDETLLLAGGVALNCVANTRLLRDGPFRHVWVQPAAGDAGTAFGAAAYVAHARGDGVRRMTTVAVGRGFTDDEIEFELRRARLGYEQPEELVATVAAALDAGQVVGWFQGRGQLGPGALGHRNLLVDPRTARARERLDVIKQRDRECPLTPLVLVRRAAEIFSGGPLPSPFALFVHDVDREWRRRIPAVVHVDGTARVQTVDADAEPLLAALLGAFAARTGIPVLGSTSFNVAGEPVVDSPRDAIECFAAAAIDLLVLGRCVVRRAALVAAPAAG